MPIRVLQDDRDGARGEIVFTVCADYANHVQPPARCPADIGPLTFGKVDPTEANAPFLARAKAEMKLLAQAYLAGQVARTAGGLAGTNL